MPWKESIAELEILSSRFIGVFASISEERDFASLLGELKERFPKATHYVYAWRLLPGEGMSDDGEPKGSVGLPLLDLLRKKEVNYGALVLIRYFGGTKLGLSRLSRVYRECAMEAIERASEGEFVMEQELSIRTDYATYDALHHYAQRAGLREKNVDFSLEVSLLLAGDAKIIELTETRFQGKLVVCAREEKRILRRKDR